MGSRCVQTSVHNRKLAHFRAGNFWFLEDGPANSLIDTYLDVSIVRCLDTLAHVDRTPIFPAHDADGFHNGRIRN